MMEFEFVHQHRALIMMQTDDEKKKKTISCEDLEKT